MKTLILLATLLSCPTIAALAQSADESTSQTGVQTVYPEKVTVPAELRAKLKKYNLAIPEVRQDIPRISSVVSYQQVLNNNKTLNLEHLIEFEDSLYPLKLIRTPKNLNEQLSNLGMRVVLGIPMGIQHGTVQCEPAELTFLDFLDKIAASAKVGWTAREDNGEVIVRFVRLKTTPAPESFLYESAWAGLPTESSQSYPESVSVSEAMRKQLEGIRVNVNLIDRNGVGALMALLDARVDHQFDPSLKLSLGKSNSFLVADIQALQARDPEWSYPGLRLQKVTIKANGVALPTALDMLTQSLGVGWTAEAQGGRTLIRIVRLKSTPSPIKVLRDSLDTIHAIAEQLPREATPLVQTPPTAYLKEMVSLEVESASIRTTLESLLRTTNRQLELSPETSTLKRSFRFESVSLSSALNLVCDSYNVTWSLERDSKGSAFLSIRKRGEVPPKK